MVLFFRELTQELVQTSWDPELFGLLRELLKFFRLFVGGESEE